MQEGPTLRSEVRQQRSRIRLHHRMSYHFALFPFIKPYIEKKRQRNASCFTYHRGGTQENLRLSCAAAEPALERGVQAIHLLASMYLYTTDS